MRRCDRRTNGETRDVDHNQRQQHDGPDAIASSEKRHLRVTALWRGTPASRVCLQHFTGTLDNWDPAVTDPLASDGEVILFDNAGVGRSTGKVPATIAGMARHALDFLDELCTLIVNGIHDEMIAVSNSYRLSENLPNAVLLVYPDSGHGSLFQFHESFTRQTAAFLASNSPSAPF